MPIINTLPDDARRVASTPRSRTNGRLAPRIVTGGAVAASLLAVLAGADRAGHPILRWPAFALSEPSGIASRAAALAPLRAPLVTARALALARVDPVASEAAFAAASTLGWRDPAAQAWAAGAALASGQPDIAALRAEALLRAAPGNRANATILAAIAADPAASRKLAARIGGDARLARAVFAAVADLSPDQRGAAISIARAAAHDRPTREALLATGIVEHMASRDRRTAMAMQRALRGPGGLAETGLWARDFAGAEGRARTAFRWQKAEASGARLRPWADAPGLTVSSLPPVPEAVAGITTLVGAGNYVLTWRGSAGFDGAPDLLLDGQCAEPAGPVVNGEVMSRGTLHRRMITVPEGCVAIRLRILAPAAGAPRRWLAVPRLMPRVG